MKPHPNMIPIEQILLKEIQDREAVDPNYYADVKQGSIDRALALGIAPEVVARLYGLTRKN